MKRNYPFIIASLISTLMSAQNCPIPTAYDSLDINNVNARISNGGDMWNDFNGTTKYIVPKTGNVSSIYAGALWIGGLDAQGILHMAAQTFRQGGDDFFSGPLDDSAKVSLQTCLDFDRIWKVNKTTIDSFIAGLYGSPPASLVEWPGYGNPYLGFVQQELAPYVDVDGNNYYDATQGDYPAIPGDQALWFVFNDKGNIHYQTDGLPLGIEVQCFAYAVKDPNTCTYSTTFYHYKIINKSVNDYNNVYVGLWTVPELGCYSDDYIGSDSAHNLGLNYNGDGFDGPGCDDEYGSQPPVLALQLLKGPTDVNGTTHYLDHTMRYVNDFSVNGIPEIPDDFYNYLKSIWKDGSHLTYGGDGYGGSTPTNFIYSGDPPDPNGWSGCSENAVFYDQRFIISSGPVSMLHAETKTFDVAVVWDNTSVYPCPSFAVMDSVAACVKDYFDGIVFISGTGNISSPNQIANVFPNPVEGSAVINFSGQHIDRVEIFDVAGRKLLSVAGEKENVKVSSNNLGQGLYIYQITFSNHSFQSGKLVVQ